MKLVSPWMKQTKVVLIGGEWHMQRICRKEKRKQGSVGRECCRGRSSRKEMQ